MTPSDRSLYRPDIDGLRVLAILSVLFYHLDSEWFSGDYSGIDIIFVISGYLITGIIKKEVGSMGTVSFKSFYIRRCCCSC